MSDQFKLDGDGHCKSCKAVPAPGETIQCYTCSGTIHAICSGASTEDKVATKTMINSFLLSSTKRNFVFYCDICLTKMEINKADADSLRVNILEEKMEGIDKQLNEIMKVLSGPVPSKKKNDDSKIQEQSKYNIWFDSKKLESIKAPEPKAVLVINKDADTNKNVENQNVIEKIVLENEIQLSDSHKSGSGDIVLVCEKREARDKLKDLVHTADEGIAMISPKVKQVPITIVGLPREYSKDDSVKMLVSQNQYIKKFSAINNINEHITIHHIKPLRNKPTIFQIFASVSPILREGFQTYKNKVVIGLSPCKIYDRKQVRRCNNCQQFGHFIKDCTTLDDPKCAKCGENHRTDSCSSETRNCINCVRNNLTDTCHPAFYYKCPCLVKFQESSLNSKGTSSNRPK